jgi:hypothetical protein
MYTISQEKDKFSLFFSYSGSRSRNFIKTGAGAETNNIGSAIRQWEKLKVLCVDSVISRMGIEQHRKSIEWPPTVFEIKII